MPSNPEPSDRVIVSDLAFDPDMAELVELFVSELPGRAGKVSAAFDAGRWSDLAIQAHQLRGSSAGHGFPQIGAIAGRLEDLVRGAQGKEQSAAARIRAQVEELTDLCRRARARG